MDIFKEIDNRDELLTVINTIQYFPDLLNFPYLSRS